VIYGKKKKGYEMSEMNISALHIISFLQWQQDPSLFIALSNVSFSAGGILGSLISGKMINSWGRNKSLVKTNLLFLLSLALVRVIQTAVPYISTFLSGRFVSGVCCGCFSVIPPIFISEISPSSLRAKIGVCIQLGLTFGIFLSFSVASMMETLLQNLDFYLIIILFPSIFSILQVYLLLHVFDYDSPAWLHQSQKHVQAEQLLKKIYKPCHWQKRLNLIESEEFRKNQSFSQNSLKIALKNPKFLSCLLFFLQQFSGMYAFLFYSKFIFGDEKVSEKESSLMTLMIGAVNFLTVLPNFWMISKVPRKMTLTFGLLGMGVCNVFFYCKDLLVNGEKRYLIEFCVFVVYDWLYQAGIGAVVWIYLTEILGVCWVGTAVTVRWICAAVNVTVFPLVFMKYFDEQVEVYFLASAVVCIFGSFFVVRLASPLKDYDQFKNASRTVLVKRTPKN
jgi:MFS family permease